MSEHFQILVAGGDRDPNLQSLRLCLKIRGYATIPLRVGHTTHPTIQWDLSSDELSLGGERIRPQAAFVRHDVFSYFEDSRPEVLQRSAAWYTAVMAWLACHPEVRFPNRRGMNCVLWKPHVLHLAAKAGLAIPETLVGNSVEDLDRFAQGRDKIAKPINGGGFCRRLSETLSGLTPREGAAAAPAIIQPELVSPDLRIYAIGGRFIAFSIQSDALDYRTSCDARILPLSDPPADLTAGLARLMAELHLDFCAADFKTCARTGAPLFLEINDAPMFAAFDDACGGTITGALVDYLGGCTMSDSPPIVPLTPDDMRGQPMTRPSTHLSGEETPNLVGCTLVEPSGADAAKQGLDPLGKW